MICEECGKQSCDRFKPLCYECYVECMEEFDKQYAIGLAEMIIKMGNTPGVAIHFPSGAGYLKMENGQVSLSDFGEPKIN